MAKNRSVSGEASIQPTPSSKTWAGMGPWVSASFSETGANPFTFTGAMSTRAVRWALSDWT